MTADRTERPLENIVSPLPCPFCGGLRVTVNEGSTFRWRYAECLDCGARAGEIRRQTIGEGTPDQWERKAEADAIVEWNKRTNAALSGWPGKDETDTEK